MGTNNDRPWSTIAFLKRYRFAVRQDGMDEELFTIYGKWLVLNTEWEGLEVSVRSDKRFLREAVALGDEDIIQAAEASLQGSQTALYEANKEREKFEIAQLSDYVELSSLEGDESYEVRGLTPPKRTSDPTKRFEQVENDSLSNL